MSSQPVTPISTNQIPSNLSVKAQLQQEHLRLLRQAGKKQELALNAKLQASMMRDIQRRQHVALNSALGVYRPPSRPPLPIETVLQNWQLSWHRRAVMFQPPPLERIVFSEGTQPAQIVVQSPAPQEPQVAKQDEGFPSWLNYDPKPQAAEVLAVVEEVEDKDLTQPRLPAVKASSATWGIADVPTNAIGLTTEQKARLQEVLSEEEPQPAQRLYTKPEGEPIGIWLNACFDEERRSGHKPLVVRVHPPFKQWVALFINGKDGLDLLPDEKLPADTIAME